MNSTKIRKWYKYATYDENIFVIKIVAIYVGWKIVHYFLLHAPVVSNLWAKFIIQFGSFYAAIASFILNAAGQDTFRRGISVVFQYDGRYIKAEEHCLAIPAMVLFSFSILFFSGKRSDKLWFIPMGIFAVFVINTIRFTLLCYSFEHLSAAFFEVNHSLVYVVITYGLIMGLIVWWINKFGSITVQDIE